MGFIKKPSEDFLYKWKLYFEQLPFKPFFQSPDYYSFLQSKNAGLIESNETGVAVWSIKGYIKASSLFYPFLQKPELTEFWAFLPIMKRNAISQISIEGEGQTEDLHTLIIDANSWHDAELSKHHTRLFKKAGAVEAEITRVNNVEDVKIWVNAWQQRYLDKKLKWDRLRGPDFYEYLGNLSIAKPSIAEFLLLKIKGEVVAGCVFLQFGKYLYYEAGFGNSIGSFPALPVLLYHQYLKAKEQLWSFDLGGYSIHPDIQLQGINRLKQGFGGQLVHFPAL